MLKKGANPNVLLSGGAAPIHLVVGMDNELLGEKMTRLFLEFGGDPNVRYVCLLKNC